MISLSTRKTRLVVLLAAALGIVSLGDDCQGDIVEDPTFRDWCGDTLCDWTLDSGHIKAVPTWSADDLGVDFEGMGTQISQVTSENQATCVQFTSVANTDESAELTLEVDFNNDGIIDFQQQISGQWTQSLIEITAPPDYDGITFHIRQEGSGTAVLAEMRIQSTTGCTAAPPKIKNEPLGDACSADTDCTSKICSDPAYFNPSQVCAQCSTSHPCPNGETCTFGPYGFEQCDPGQAKVATGKPCVANDDCASGQCLDDEFLGFAAEPPDAGDAGNCRPTTADAGTANTEPRDAGASDAHVADAGATDASFWGSADGASFIPTFPCASPPTLVQGGTCR